MPPTAGATGMLTLTCELLIQIAGTAAPFTDTVQPLLNPDPFSVTEADVLTGRADVGAESFGIGFFSVICAAADLVVSAWLVAVIVTGETAVAGPVYRPELDMVPTEAFPPEMPFTDQLTALFFAFWTPALNWTESRPLKVALCGETEILTAAGVPA